MLHFSISLSVEVKTSAVLLEEVPLCYPLLLAVTVNAARIDTIFCCSRRMASSVVLLLHHSRCCPDCDYYLHDYLARQSGCKWCGLTHACQSLKSTFHACSLLAATLATAEALRLG